MTEQQRFEVTDVYGKTRRLRLTPTTPNQEQNR